MVVTSLKANEKCNNHGYHRRTNYLLHGPFHDADDPAYSSIVNDVQRWRGEKRANWNAWNPAAIRQNQTEFIKPA